MFLKTTNATCTIRIYFVHISIVNERANCQMMPNPFHVTATQMKKHSLIWHIRTSLCLLRIFLTTMSVAVLGICSNEDWHLLWDHLSCRSQRGLCWRILICKLLMWFLHKKSASKNCLLLTILKKPWDKSVIFMRVCNSLSAMILLHIKWGFLWN